MSIQKKIFISYLIHIGISFFIAIFYYLYHEGNLGYFDKTSEDFICFNILLFFTPIFASIFMSPYFGIDGLFVYLFVYLLIYLFVYLLIYLFICRKKYKFIYLMMAIVLFLLPPLPRFLFL